MSFKCKIFGHKWNVYKEDVSHVIIKKLNSLSMTSLPSFTYVLNTQFRICDRCYYKQVRDHYTGRETDWSKCDLSAEELRDKNLKELGI
jgi:hypothetical protein